MKKIVIAAVIIIVVAGGVFAILHKKSPKSTSSSNSPAISQSTASTTNNAVLVTKTNASIGKYLANPSGMTLYTYDADSKGVSNCTGSCLQAWPTYVDKSSTTNLPAGVGTIKRTDNGEIQYTYNGLPLYFFVSDKPGEVTGNGVQNFSVAKPVSTSSVPSSTPSQPSKTSSTSNTNW